MDGCGRRRRQNGSVIPARRAFSARNARTVLFHNKRTIATHARTEPPQASALVGQAVCVAGRSA